MMYKDRKDTTKPLYEYLSIWPYPLHLNVKLLQVKFMKNLITKEHPETL